MALRMFVLQVFTSGFGPWDPALPPRVLDDVGSLEPSGGLPPISGPALKLEFGAG